ncbi:MAG TPA: lamin tail domain-containing protein [Candidatus Methanomethylophilaceae archaeon]|nr:lamin tail domain-containing protein [Candidatus Methanomethylophilaceae archaeon]
MIIARDRKGNMPFAVIAVTILLLTLGYGVVTSQIENAEENADDVTKEIEAIGDAVHRSESFINRGLGEVLASMGKQNGTVSSKINDFNDSSERWMSKQFPSMDGCVKITILGFDIKLVSENMKIEGRGYSPTYLKATGTLTARYECDSGSAEKTLDISSDGSCALPLVSEMSSLFELSLSGNGSVLSQMMMYQLTALAQERVINGYGSIAATGNMGTKEIITTEDVQASYRSCVSAIELISFKNSSTGTVTGSGKLDLADILASDDNHIKINLGAIYAQALMSVLDKIVLQWSDYFCGNLVVNFLDGTSDLVKNAWDSVVNFFTGKDTMSASPYIREIMEQNGYSEQDYRYLWNGKQANYNVPVCSVTKIIDGESKTVSVGGFNASVRYPSVDILNWDGISNFKSEYRLQNNEVREWIRSILNTTAMNIGADRSIGQISIPIGIDDDRPFTEDLRRAVNGSLSKLDADVERVVNNSIKNQKIYDPFYSAICTKLTDNFDSVFGVNELKNRMLAQVNFSAIYVSLNNSGLDHEEKMYLLDSLKSAVCNEEVIEGYRDAAYDMLSKFDALLKVPDGQSGLIKKFFVMIGEKAMPMLSIINDIPERMINLCNEMCHNMNVNPYSGIINVPEENYFGITSASGIAKETILIKDNLDPIIKVQGPNQNLNDCVHYVGFNEKKGASYCTVFRVSLDDTIEYTAEGRGTISSILGVSDSSMSGTVPISVDIKIVVVSSWGLSGVSSYKASNTIFSDGWALLIKVLEPLLEPLRKIFEIVSEVMVLISSSLLELSKYVSDVVEKLYNAIMGPIIELKQFIEEQLDGIMNQSVGEFAGVVEYVFKATMKKQTVGLSFMGLTLTFTTDLASLVKNVKTVLTVNLSGEVSGLFIKCGVTIKEKDLKERKDFFITGKAYIKGDDWDVEINIDPFMKSMNHLATINGEARGISFDIVFPHVVQYREASMKISDIEGIGDVLSNIPLPLLGLKGSFDAGLNLKYNIPFETGVVVNEFESNPPGNDLGNEWVELYNSSNRTVDISGYSISAGSNEKIKRMTLGETVLSPHERLLIILDRHVVLLNDKNDTLNGDCVILRNREGIEIDRSIVGKDKENSNYTWQRVADGAIDWTFAKGTPGTGNCGGLVNGDMVKGQMKNIFKKSAVRTLSNMGGTLNGTEDLNEFIQRAIQDAITTTIDMIAGCLVEASIFVSFEVMDVSGASATGIRIALSIDSKTVGDTIKFLVGELETLLFNMENPYGIDGGTMFYDNIDLAMTVYTGIKAPGFLGKVEGLPEIKIGVYIASNLSGLCTLFGKDIGKWSVTAGIMIEDCPSVLIPSNMSADANLKSDLWLVKAVIGAV